MSPKQLQPLLIVASLGIGAIAVAVNNLLPLILAHFAKQGTAMSGGGAAAKMLFSVVYVTVPSVEVGKRIAHQLVRDRLAACVNIVPQLTSVYEWKGRVEEESESLLIIKTAAERMAALQAAVTKMHPYEVPEFIALPIEHGSDPYLQWMAKQTSGEPIEESKQPTDCEQGSKPDE